MEHFKDDVECLGFHVNHLKNFHTSEFVNKFILKNMSEYPEWRFMDLIDEMIDQAFEIVREEGLTPQNFSMVFLSETLDTPICIPLRPREQNNADFIMNGILKLPFRRKIRIKKSTSWKLVIKNGIF